jgi:hypothetical protein
VDDDNVLEKSLLIEDMKKRRAELVMKDHNHVMDDTNNNIFEVANQGN